MSNSASPSRRSGFHGSHRVGFLGSGPSNRLSPTLFLCPLLLPPRMRVHPTRALEVSRPHEFRAVLDSGAPGANDHKLGGLPRVHMLTGLEAGSRRPKCQQGWFHLRLWGNVRESVPASADSGGLLATLGVPSLLEASRCPSRLCPRRHAVLLLCVSASKCPSSWKDTFGLD